MTRIGVQLVIQREDPWSTDARLLLDELSATLALFTRHSGQASFFLEDFCTPRAAFLIARTAAGEPVGCGAFRRFDYGVAELKRLYSRRFCGGVGKAILAQLQELATDAGYHTLLTETSLANRRTMDFFWRNGFAPVLKCSPYGAWQSEVFLEKALSTPA
jgi:GNAT superfamily N-acetyltransferase